VTGHLLHVGFPKTGSNFLRRWFRAHPQLAYRDGAIAGYGDVYEIAREAAAPRPDVRYRVTSSESFTAPHRDSGQDHYTYTDPIDPAIGQETACTQLAALFPNAHILLVTRGFRSMIVSSYSQYVRSGAGIPFEEFVQHPLLDRPWDYDRVIGLYRSAFGAENVIVMPYELLRDDAARFLRTLEDRLGLAHTAPASDRLNPALTPAELYWYPRLTRLVHRLPAASRLKRLVLRGIFLNRLRPAITLLQRLRPRPPVTANAIPETQIAKYRTKAQTLRYNPHYAAYARDYYQE
jgi:hypothetical protein